MKKVTVYFNDFESFIVLFDGDEAVSVQQIRTIWSKERGSTNTMLSTRAQKAIETARQQRNKDE